MDSTTQKHVGNLRSEDRELQNQAFSYILQETEKPVAWAYEVWDQLVEGLRHKDNHVRAISAQILANLAKSDPKNRMQKDFSALMAVTNDEKFVTAPSIEAGPLAPSLTKNIPMKSSGFFPG